MSYPTAIDGNNKDQILNRLRAPFLDEEVDWRVDRVFAAGQYGPAKVVLLAYLDQRAVLDRLDNVLGPHNWQSQLRRFPNGCDAGIGILIRKEWIWKWDGAGQRSMAGNDSHHEPKAAASDAIKRAAMQWGMGRHLYDLPATKVEVLAQKPGGVPACRVIRVFSRKEGVKGWAIAPSVRELQAHLLTVEDLVQDIPDPKARRMARIEMVRVKMGWPHPSQVEQGAVPQILAAFEAASAVWEDGRPTHEGQLLPSNCSVDQLKVASHRLVQWMEAGDLQDKLQTYAEWKLGGGSRGPDDGGGQDPTGAPPQEQGGQSHQGHPGAQPQEGGSPWA